MEYWKELWFLINHYYQHCSKHKLRSKSFIIDDIYFYFYNNHDYNDASLIFSIKSFFIKIYEKSYWIPGPKYALKGRLSFKIILSEVLKLRWF